MNNKIAINMYVSRIGLKKLNKHTNRTETGS